MPPLMVGVMWGEVSERYMHWYCMCKGWLRRCKDIKAFCKRYKIDTYLFIQGSECQVRFIKPQITALSVDPWGLHPVLLKALVGVNQQESFSIQWFYSETLQIIRVLTAAGDHRDLGQCLWTGKLGKREWCYYVMLLWDVILHRLPGKVYAKVLERRWLLIVDSGRPLGDLDTVDQLFTFVQLSQVT